jgi:hypothetical protein
MDTLSSSQNPFQNMPEARSESPSIILAKEITSLDLEKTAVQLKWKRAKQKLRQIVAGASRDTKIISEKYWVEIVDNGHRHRKNIAPYFDRWKSSDTKDDLNTWLQSIQLPETFKKMQFLDERSRKEYEMHVDQEGRVFTAKDGYLTLSQKESLFVIGPDERWYVAKQEKRRFHHCSFFAGGAVKSAGQLIVEKGKIIAISNESGHYEPSKEMLDRALTSLQQQGVDTQHIQVIVRK